VPPARLIGGSTSIDCPAGSDDSTDICTGAVSPSGYRTDMVVAPLAQLTAFGSRRPVPRPASNIASVTGV
jgi:hypothetical protein